MAKVASPLRDEPQPELDFGIRERARGVWEEQSLPAVQSTVTRLTRKEVAWQLGIAGPLLNDQLAQRDRKQLRVPELVAIALMGNETERAAILGPIAEALGFELKPVERMTPEQLVARYEALLDEELAPGRAAELKRKARGR